MSKTMMRAGMAIAVYVDDGQGRRLVLASQDGEPGELWASMLLRRPVVLATTQAEAKAAIAVLKQLAEELPP